MAVVSDKGEGDSRSLPLSYDKKAPWCSSKPQVADRLLTDSKLMHLCGQVVIVGRGVDDQLRLAGLSRLRSK